MRSRVVRSSECYHYPSPQRILGVMRDYAASAVHTKAHPLDSPSLPFLPLPLLPSIVPTVYYTDLLAHHAFYCAHP